MEASPDLHGDLDSPPWDVCVEIHGGQLISIEKVEVRVAPWRTCLEVRRAPNSMFLEGGGTPSMDHVLKRTCSLKLDDTIE